MPATVMLESRPVTFSISKKIGAVFLAFLLMTGANVVIVHLMLEKLNGVAETVNVAGKLRMLSQKIAFEATRAMREGERMAPRTAALLMEFEATLAALKSGGSAFGYALRALPQKYAPTLAAMDQSWEAYRAAIAAAPLRAAGSAADLQYTHSIAQGAESLLGHADALVSLLTADSQQAQRRCLRQMQLVLLLDGLVLLLVFLGVRRKIVFPLRTLASQAQTLAHGNYAFDVAHRSRDEIGQLAVAFSDSARQIGELISGAAQDRRNIERAEAMFRGLAENAVVGVYMVQGQAFRFVNPKMAALFGYGIDEMMSSVRVFDLVPEHDRPLVEQNMQRRLIGEVKEVHYERKARRKDGTIFDVEVFGSIMRIDGEVATIGMMLDITERKHAEMKKNEYSRQLEFHANHDVLTGLANRNLLSRCLRQAIDSATQAACLVAVMLLDLDRFKVINDSLGHAVGDSLLQAVARRLSSCVRQSDTVARLGGDEFVIVMPGLQDSLDARTVAGKVLEVLARPFVVQEHELYISASIGITLSPDDGSHEDVLLKNVDLAMYRAKQRGRSNFQFYTQEIHNYNRERHVMETELHAALQRNEFALHFQPKVNALDGAISGIEALVRWNHPSRGMISPDKFISLAEDTGLIMPIGAWVLKMACRQNKAWQDAGLPEVRMAVNLSARQFRQNDLLNVIKDTLEETGLAPQFLELELTESMIMQEAEDAVATLMELKSLGIQISLDDFGTGYSSLSYLRRFPLDTLKIDRSFVKGISSHANDSTIVKAVIALAHNLDLKVTAEGVETRDELDFLGKLGCDEIQGYYFSPPLPATQFEEYWRHAQARVAAPGLC